jgi:hypothetical protein
MAAISTAAQAMTEHLVKKRFLAQLDMVQADPLQEARRQSILHVITGFFGGLLPYTISLHPLRLLLTTESVLTDVNVSSGLRLFLEYAIVGVMVSYGGSFFNEALGVLRQFKLTQEQLRTDTAALLPATTTSAPAADGAGDLGVREEGTEGFDTRYLAEPDDTDVPVDLDANVPAGGDEPDLNNP